MTYEEAVHEAKNLAMDTQVDFVVFKWAEGYGISSVRSMGLAYPMVPQKDYVAGVKVDGTVEKMEGGK